MNQGNGITASNLTKVFKGGSGFKLGKLNLRLDRRKKIKALDSLFLEVSPGESFGLIGPNGAGKTTFLSILLGYLRPDEGEVLIDGLSPNTIGAKRLIGYLPERLNFDHWMSGFEFLEYHHALAEQPVAKRKSDIEEFLQNVALEPKMWSTPLKTYSRGMLQRLGLAQALIGKPKYLLLDEPASGIDPRGIILIKKILSQLKEQGLTLLLNSHQLDQVEHICDRVAFLESGKITRIEDLRAQVEDPRLLKITFSTANLERVNATTIEAIARKARAQFVKLENLNATFMVVSNEVAVALIKKLVEEDLPVMEASPLEGRLERLFDSAQTSAAKTDEPE